MRRLLLQWRGLRIYTYPTLLIVAFLGGILAWRWASHHSGLDSVRDELAILALIPPTRL